MHAIREDMTRAFEQLGRKLYRYHRSVIALFLVLLAAAGSQLHKLSFDTSTEGFLAPDNPALVTYNRFLDQYGRDELIVIASDPPAVFDLTFLNRLKALHEALKAEVPHIDDITSLINARNTRGEGDELVVESLMEDWPETDKDLRDLEKRVMESDFYRNFLISEDGRVTALVIKTSPFYYLPAEEDVLSGFDDLGTGPGVAEEKPRHLTDRENTAIVDQIRRVVARFQAPDFPLHMAGPPVVAESLKAMMRADIRLFVVLTIVVIAAVLFGLFRRWDAVFLPLLVVVCALVTTLGIMAASGVPIKPPTQILPSLLLAVGVADSVHILAQFLRRLRGGESKEDAIAGALGHSALPVVMTSLTTAAGLASFTTAEIAPVADLGVFATIGVLLALAFSILLLPALLALVPHGSTREAQAGHHALLDRLLKGTAAFSVTHARAILLASATLFVLAALAASQLRFSHNPLTWLPAHMEAREATEFLDRELGGTISVELLVNTGRENGLYEPRLLKGLEATATGLRQLKDDEIFVGKTWSIVDIVKEIHQALNGNQRDYYRIPDSRSAVAQELLLFENTGNDDLRDVVDSLFSEARLTAKVPWVDAIKYQGYLDRVKELAERKLGSDAKVTVTGIMVLLARTIHATMVSAVSSYLVAFLVITLLMMLAVGGIGQGLLSMIPNLLPIILSMGVMWLGGIPLDMFTILIGSIAIGLAVDDTIHFLHQFRRFHDRTGNTREAIALTFQTTGSALLITSVVLSMGFFVFLFATMGNLVHFGFLTGFAILAALAADFLLLPALLATITRDRVIQHGTGDPRDTPRP